MRFEDWHIIASEWTEQNPFRFRHKRTRVTLAPATSAFAPAASSPRQPIIATGCIFYLHPQFYRYSGSVGALDPKYKTYPITSIHAHIPKLTPKTYLTFFARLLQYHSETGGKISSDKLSAACEALAASDYKKRDCPRGGLIAWLQQLDTKVHEWKGAFLRSEYVIEILVALEAPTVHKWFSLEEVVTKPWDEIIGLNRFIEKKPAQRLKIFTCHVTSTSWQESQELVEAMATHDDELKAPSTTTKIQYGTIHTPFTHQGAWYEFPVIRFETLLAQRAQPDRTDDVCDTVKQLELTAEELLQWSLLECMMKDLENSAFSSFRMNSFKVFDMKQPVMKLEWRTFRKTGVPELYVAFQTLFQLQFPFDSRFWSEDDHDSALRMLYESGHVVMTYEGKTEDVIMKQIQQRRAANDNIEFFVTPTYYWRNAERIYTSMCRIQVKATERHAQKKCTPTNADGEEEAEEPEEKTADAALEKPAHLLDLNLMVQPPAGVALSDQQRAFLFDGVRDSYSQPLIISDSRAGCGKTTCLKAIKGADEKDVWKEHPMRVRVRIRAERWFCTITNQLASFLSTLFKCPVYTVTATTESMKFGMKRFEHVNVMTNDELGLQPEVAFGDWIEYTSYLPALQRVVMTGDRAQIPSIGPGNVIEDLAKFALASERKPCVVYPLTHNFRQGAEASKHIFDMQRGKFPMYSTVDLTRAEHILEDMEAYHRGVRAPAVLGPSRGFSPFMLDMYRGWYTYDYIYKLSKKAGWPETHIVCFSHKLRAQTNRAMTYLCGFRGDKPPRLDHWTYDGSRRKKKPSNEEEESIAQAKARGRTSATRKKDKVAVPADSVGEPAAAAAEEEEPVEDEDAPIAPKRRRQNMDELYPMYPWQKIQFRNNRDLALMLPDPEEDGHFLEPDETTPTKRMNRNRVSIIQSIFNCVKGEPIPVKCTRELTFRRGMSACLQLVDCDDVGQEPYCVEVPWLVFKNDIGRGYCSTVDSAQGTQRKIIIVLVEPMALRKRMYTAFSRGVNAAIGFFRPYDNPGRACALAPHLDMIKRCFVDVEPQRVTALGCWLSHDVQTRGKKETQVTVSKRKHALDVAPQPPSYTESTAAAATTSSMADVADLTSPFLSDTDASLLL